VTVEPEAPTAVPDLMAALEASLSAAKGGKQKLTAAAAKSNGAKKASPKPKKAPAKRAATKKPRAKTRS
jgi:hypothetical protein